ncbi:hypothetical protein [Spirobacillus cienkowskii]|uniref:hypothetical protein n=1 Tax=Spirobacillus cienkowskii TaxID=495820 RepID=UPI0030CF1942
MLLVESKIYKISINLAVCIFSILLPFNSFSKTEKNTIIYYNLMPALFKNESSFPLPKMNGIDDYFYNHNNSLPQTWGKENVNLETYKNLDLNKIGTQIVCTKNDGCEGYANIYRRFHENNAYSTITIDYVNYADTSHHPITFIEMDKPIMNSVTYRYTDGKFYNKNIETLATGGSLIGLDFYFYYKANKGEVITYLPFNYVPGLTGNAFLDIDNEDILNKSIPYKLIDPNGKEETIEYSTRWILKGYDQIYPDISFNRTFQISHGFSESDTYSWAFQLGAEESLSVPLFASLKLTQGITYTSTKQTTVSDSTVVSESVTFPAKNYPAVAAIYSLYMVSKTSAPRLESLMKLINKSIKQKEKNCYFQWELVKTNSMLSDDFDNMVDAKPPSSSMYINSFISIKIN